MKKLTFLFATFFLLLSCGKEAETNIAPVAPKQEVVIPKAPESTEVTKDTAWVTVTSSWVSADDALKILMDWNSRFVKWEKLVNLDYNDSPSIREWLGKGQNPYAIILTCSDSRLPPELIFDQGLGQIFVIRVAGNVIAPHEIGSIEYAIEHLKTKLIMVLGHENCWAVKATYQAVMSWSVVEGNLGTIVSDITPSVKKVLASTKATTDAEKVEECIVENINNVWEWLETKSSVIKEFVEKEWVKIVRAKYDLDEWKVTLLEAPKKEEVSAGTWVVSTGTVLETPVTEAPKK